MIVAGFAYNAKIKRRGDNENASISFSYYQNNTLVTIFNDEVPSLYPHAHPTAELRQDKQAAIHLNTL